MSSLKMIAVCQTLLSSISITVVCSEILQLCCFKSWNFLAVFFTICPHPGIRIGLIGAFSRPSMVVLNRLQITFKRCSCPSGIILADPDTERLLSQLGQDDHTLQFRPNNTSDLTRDRN